MIDFNKNTNAPFEKLSTIVDNKTPPTQPNPTPILVLYLEINNIDNIEEIMENTAKEMDHFRTLGWEYLIIPSKLPTKLECLSVNNIDYIEFEKLKTEILSKWTN